MGRKTLFKRQDLITSSEIARYVYCQRAWWYDRQNRLKGKSDISPEVSKVRLNVLFFFSLPLMAWQHGTHSIELAPDDEKTRKMRRQWTSWEYGLTGKADYLIKRTYDFIPLIRKSGQVGEFPYDSHVAQVVSLCLLVQERKKYIPPPPYGIIRYDNRIFEVDYDEAAFSALLDLLDEIRIQRKRGVVLSRSHDEARRCAGCSHRKRCEDALHGSTTKSR